LLEEKRRKLAKLLNIAARLGVVNDPRGDYLAQNSLEIAAPSSRRCLLLACASFKLIRHANR
jgi:hypothetical protein